MSITDELRAWAKGSTLSSWTAEHLTVIADRIDAEHERAVTAAHSNGITEYGSMVASEYVKLPVDADGECVHIGDVMEWVDIEGEVTLTCEVAAVGVECFFAWDKANGRYAQKNASAYRHHHAPTVEDVLREFALKVAGEECMTMRTGVVEEYAAKLRLAESEDA